MPYFSRLTDIVTCNLTGLLESESDPIAAIGGIIAEMNDGVNGANRSLATALRNEQRIQSELDDHDAQAEVWTQRAKDSLVGGDEDDARDALMRKGEHLDLVAVLSREHREAVGTVEHLRTTLRALEARLADARRKQAELTSDAAVADTPAAGRTANPSVADASSARARSSQIEAELAALKKQLDQTS